MRLAPNSLNASEVRNVPSKGMSSLRCEEVISIRGCLEGLSWAAANAASRVKGIRLPRLG